MTVCWSLFGGLHALRTDAGGPRLLPPQPVHRERPAPSLVRGDDVRDLRNNAILNWRVAGIYTSELETPKINVVNCFFSPAVGSRDPARALEIRARG